MFHGGSAMSQSIEERFQQCIDGWYGGIYGRAEVASIVFECLMESYEVSFFLRAPEEFKAGVVEILESFRRSGNAEWIVAHTGLHIDRTAEMHRLLEAMAAAGLVHSGEMAIVASPPVIDGIASITDADQLQDILSFESRLLDCSIEAYSIRREPYGYRNQAEFSLLVTQNVRQWQNETAFRRIACSRWLATFSLSQVFGEPAPERQIVNHCLISVVPQLAGRRKYCLVKIYDLFGDAMALRCKEIRLASLKQLPIDDESMGAQ